jgi:hypothetical protein
MSSSLSKHAAFAALEDIRLALFEGDVSDPGDRTNILATISTLRRAVETPLDSALRILSQPMQNATLRVATEMDLLSAWKGRPTGTILDLDDLAARSNCDRELIGGYSPRESTTRR